MAEEGPTAVSLLDGLREYLEKNLIEQPQAVKRIVSAVAHKISGFDPGVPAGCLLTGSSGTGKSYAPQLVAEYFGVLPVVIDVNPREIHFDPGLLEKNPDAPTIVVFENIEQSEQMVNAIITILREGKIGSGPKELDFSHCIIFMTSSVGAEELKLGIGFNNDSKTHESVFSTTWKAGQLKFGDSFLGQVGEEYFIAFGPFSREGFARIIDLELARFTLKMKTDHGITVEFSPRVREYLLEKVISNEASFGAHKIKTRITYDITSKITDGLLKAKDAASIEEASPEAIFPGDVVKFDVKETDNRPNRYRRIKKEKDTELCVSEVDTTERHLEAPTQQSDTAGTGTSSGFQDPLQEEVPQGTGFEEDADGEVSKVLVETVQSGMGFTLILWKSSLEKIARFLDQKLIFQIFGELAILTNRYGPIYFMNLPQEVRDRAVFTLADKYLRLTGRSQDECMLELYSLLHGRPDPDAAGEEPQPEAEESNTENES